MSHLLFNTTYVETPYTLLAIDEPAMIGGANNMHGEQVGIATMTMSLLQHETLNNKIAPIMHPTVIDKKALENQFGADRIDNVLNELNKKALDEKRCEQLNITLEQDWETLRHRLKEVMLPYEALSDAMGQAGCQRTASDLGLDVEFYRQAVAGARYIRDRFSMLDLVDDSTGLEPFVASMPV